MTTLPWIVTHHAPTAFTPAVRRLSMIGIEPEVHVVTETFLPVPFLVAGTRRIALLRTPAALRLADAAGVRRLPCPWDVVPLKEAFWWHPAHHTDPAHRWLRDLLLDIARAVD
ncbi:hypothetical protein LY40_003834 [Prauserella salsuginis]|nr:MULTISPECIES: hypothetical protein [Prauserella salsuginis group]MCR3736141.1 hypothetical protein [Prauserella salsuginis]